MVSKERKSRKRKREVYLKSKEQPDCKKIKLSDETNVMDQSITSDVEPKERILTKDEINKFQSRSWYQRNKDMVLKKKMMSSSPVKKKWAQTEQARYAKEPSKKKEAVKSRYALDPTKKKMTEKARYTIDPTKQKEAVRTRYAMDPTKRKAAEKARNSAHKPLKQTSYLWDFYYAVCRIVSFDKQSVSKHYKNPSNPLFYCTRWQHHLQSQQYLPFEQDSPGSRYFSFRQTDTRFIVIGCELFPIKKMSEEPPFVVLETTMGSVELELYWKHAPKTCKNFAELTKVGYYNNVTFHRIIPDFMIQGGDPTGTGRGGSSIFGKAFEDEIHPDLKHSGAGILSMANSGPNTNGSQFFVTLAPCQWLDGKHTIFGRVNSGMRVIQRISKVPIDNNDRPLEDVKIVKSSLRNVY